MTPLEALKFSLDKIKLSSDDTLIDLGSGAGTDVVYASKYYGCHSVGYESNSKWCDIANKTAIVYNVQDKVKIVNSTLFNADLSKFTVIFLFQFKYNMKKLSKKILNEVDLGKVRIIAYRNPLLGIKPKDTITFGRWNIYFYGDV